MKAAHRPGGSMSTAWAVLGAAEPYRTVIEQASSRMSRPRTGPRRCSGEFLAAATHICLHLDRLMRDGAAQPAA
jgi:hypothetical protein